MLAAMGPLAGVAQQQFTAMVDLLQKSVREVHLTVMWKDGNQTESIDLVTHVVSLGRGSDRNGGAAAAAGQASSGAAADQWVRSDTGAVVPNAQPCANGQGMCDPRDGATLITAAQFASQRGLAPGAINAGMKANAFDPAARMLTPGLGSILKGGNLLQ